MAQDSNNKNNITTNIRVEDEVPSVPGQQNATQAPREVRDALRPGESGIVLTEEDEPFRPGIERTRQPMDSIGSEGYDPNRRPVAPYYSNPNQTGTRGGSSLPRRNDLSSPNNSGLGSNGNTGLSNNSGGLENGGSQVLQPVQQVPDRAEGAPDIGKDYGSSTPSAAPTGDSGQPPAVPAASEEAGPDHAASAGRRLRWRSR